MRLIDAAMMEACPAQDGGDQTGSTDPFVLDDVTPRYATASAALNARRAGLDRAPRQLSGSGSAS